jgi:hypothetical protein
MGLLKQLSLTTCISLGFLLPHRSWPTNWGTLIQELPALGISELTWFNHHPTLTPTRCNHGSYFPARSSICLMLQSLLNSSPSLCALSAQPLFSRHFSLSGTSAIMLIHIEPLRVVKPHPPALSVAQTLQLSFCT